MSKIEAWSTVESLFYTGSLFVFYWFGYFVAEDPKKGRARRQERRRRRVSRAIAKLQQSENQ
jgi:hypothetical protein